MMTSEPLIQIEQAHHVFEHPNGKKVPVLSDINFTLYSGEIVSLLGPSGCGKSTLIRVASGLLPPEKGKILYRQNPISGPNPHMALVFQQFALYPWLTVSQNIEEALIPRDLDPATRKQKTSEAISLIGLDGFEEAFPKELSGGMKQRVGIARALAVQPEVLCMDEPFSQVDALTAETLRSEVLNLWQDREKYPLSIMMVSHDIHEVAYMASRILVMSANPGRIKNIIENPLPYPRDRQSAVYQSFVNKLHAIITGIYLPEEEKADEPVTVSVPVEAPPEVQEQYEVYDTYTIVPLPLVEVRDVIGLLESIEARGGQIALFRLTEEIDRTFTGVLLATKAAELMGFLETPQDQLILTDLGKQFLGSPRKLRKQIFSQRLIQLTIVKRLKEMLEKSSLNKLNKDYFLEELAIQCPQEDPKRLFRILVNWGKFAELWTYSSVTHEVTLTQK